MKQYSKGTCGVILQTVATALLVAGAAQADEMSSTNYSINWDVTDGGGGTAMSTNYTVTDSIGQATAGTLMSENYTLAGGFQSPPDMDADRVKNFMDNCTEVMNEDQFDSNSDGFGNVCDPDLNNDGVINFIDLGSMKSVFFTADADADLNGDNNVNFIDLGIMKAAFFGEPGPSGIAP